MINRIFASIAVLVIIFPHCAYAASTGHVPPDVRDRLIDAIDDAFGKADDVTDQLPIDDGQKGTISNVLKTRHDTVKNSIGNIR